MPGPVANAAPSEVLPHSLCRTFARSQEYAVLDNEYRNGESQRSALVATSRKRWRLAKRLTPDAIEELGDFYDARHGPQEPFYFYDPYETSPKFTPDPTGQAIPGRYTVRFEGSFDQSVGLGRADVEIQLVEIT
jgi:phage-related protein